MSSPEDREKKRRRLKRKVKEKQKTTVMKDLIKGARVIVDKHGREHNLETMTHRELIEALQEESK